MPVVDLVRVVVWPLLVAFVLWRLERPLAGLCDARTALSGREKQRLRAGQPLRAPAPCTE